MLHLHQSNRMERLAEALAALVERPAGPLLAPETVVVQHPGMARWLAMRLAQAHGICAGVEFPLPARFVWRLLAAMLPGVPQRDPLERPALALRVHAALGRVSGGPSLTPVRRYLQAEGGDPRRRWRLARRLADAWDRYLVYRPQWFDDWDAGGGEDWQAELWRLAGGPALPHRAKLVREFLRRWQAGELDTTALPPRLAVFGLTGLPPGYLEVFRALAERAEVHLFLHNPCAEYWGDVVSERAHSRIARDAPERALAMEAGNTLLASLGQHGRDLLHLLYTHGEPHEHDAFEPPGADHLLARVQADILALREGPEDGAEGVPAGDASLTVHVCHSPMRECQVLKDQLLAHFERLPDLEPRDVVVMVPDIERYAPCIEAVFGGEDQPLPVTVADRLPVDSEPLLRWLDGVLALPETRFAVSEVLSLLEPAAVLRRAGVEREALDELRRWLVEHGVRWGVDGGEWPRATPGAPVPNSWAFGRLRLLTGFAVAEAADGASAPVDGVAPGQPLEGQAADRLGRLWHVVERLAGLKRALAEPRPLADWQRFVTGLLEELLAPDEADEAVLQRLRDALDALVADAELAGLAEAVPVAVLREQVAERLAEAGRAGSWLAGAITFCTLAPLRSVPFRVVCVLGLEDTSFPRNPPRPDFDLMRSRRQRGDRNPRDDDRYAFLEALLAAREALHLSYVGRDVRSGEARQPSTVLAELLDYLDRHYRLGDRRAGEAVVVEHPLQPFSARYFEPGAEPASYDSGWAAVARAAREPEAVDDGAPSPVAPPPLPEVLPVDTLARFLGQPQRGFMELRLGVHLPREEPVDEDDEPFALQGLEAHAVREALLAGLVAGREPEALAAALRASGAIPHGPAGEAELGRLLAEARRQAARVAAVSDAPAEPQALEVALSDGPVRRLVGAAEHLDRAGRRACWSASALHGRHVLALWAWHLALAAAGLPMHSVLVARDATVRLRAAAPEQARRHLEALVALYAEGLERPLPLLVESAWARECTLARGGDAKRAAAAMRTRLRGDRYHGRPGEGDEPAVRRLLGDSAEALATGPEGETLSERVFGPLRSHLELEQA